MSVAPWARSDATRFDLDIPAGRIGHSLKVLAKQTDSQLLFPYDLVRDITAARLVGDYTLEEALAGLLEGTGLQSHVSHGDVITIALESASGSPPRESSIESIEPRSSSEDQQDVNGNIVEEIFVTASKRVELLSKLPMAVTAYDWEALTERGIETAQDLQSIVPAMTVGKTALGQAQVTIRGVGTDNLIPGGDPGVPVHINGHYIQSSSWLLRDLWDVQRVEVVRGPQGTLYGRNAIGGSINILTNPPTHEFEADASIDIGNYEKVLIQGVVSGPISDSLRGRVAVSTERRDGYVLNLVDGKQYADADYHAVRVSLEQDIRNEFVISTVAYDYHDDSNSRVNRIKGDFPKDEFLTIDPLVRNPWLNAGDNISDKNPRLVKLDSQPSLLDKARGISLDIDWQQPNVLIRSLTSYDDTGNYTNGSETDGSDVVYTNIDSTIEIRTFTQELRFQSAADGDIQWITGAFYYNESSTWFFGIELFNAEGTVEPPLPYVEVMGDIDSESFGLYGHATYALTDTLDLILGGRYSIDRKHLDGNVYIPVGATVIDPPFVVRAGDEWSKVTAKVGLKYQPGERSIWYATYSNGYKAGGFNAGSLQSEAYDPETIDALEIGYKAKSRDNRFSTNLVAYRYSYRNKQEYQIEQVSTILKNAGAATVYGVEQEIWWHPTKSLAFDLGATLLTAEYEKFRSLDPIHPELGVQDLSGNTLTRTPEYKVSAGLTYQWRSRIGRITGRLDWVWVGDQYFRPYGTQRDRADSYSRGNANLRWETPEGGWRIDAYVRNIADDDVFSNAVVTAPGVGGQVVAEYLAPRTYGLIVTRNL